MIRCGIIGRGMAATVFHQQLITAVPGFELKGLYGSSNANDAISDPAIDLIVIATPNATHFELARAAIKAGKHVVIDKPYVIELKQADELAELAVATGRLAIPFHNRRWDDDFQAVRDVIAERSLGEIRLLTAHWDRFRPATKGGWREAGGDGSGILWDLGSHMLDQMLLLLGWPDAVQADVAVQRPVAQSVDYFELSFHYGSARAVIGATTIAAPPRPRFAVYGTQGSLVLNGLDPQEDALKLGQSPTTPGLADDRRTGVLTTAEGRQEALPLAQGSYLRFYEGVARSIREGTPPPVTLSEARQTLHLILAALDSAASGRRIALDR